MNIMLLKMYCFLFSAVATGLFNWLTNNRSFTKQGWTAWMDSTCFQVQSITEKVKHGNVSIVSGLDMGYNVINIFYWY